jgi:quercetin dioxygenase-like cupin family protein
MTQDHTYTRLHQLTGELLRINLTEKAQAIREEAHLSEAGRAAETIAKMGPLRLTLLGFVAGSFMHGHSAPGPVSIQVLDGVVAVTTDSATQDLTSGDVLVVQGGITHSVTARSDATILLCVHLETDTDAGQTAPVANP